MTSAPERNVGELKECQAAVSTDTDSDNSLQLECPICLQIAVHPVKLPCSHIFCYLCVKGTANRSKRCALCRTEIPPQFLHKPTLLEKEELMKDTSFEDGHQWFYEGNRGWWQYDERTSQELELKLKEDSKNIEILIAGFLYVVDFENMIQYRRNDPSRRRRIKRDRSNIEKKGIAGLRIKRQNEVSQQREREPDGVDSESTSSVSNLAAPANISNSTLVHSNDMNSNEDSQTSTVSSTAILTGEVDIVNSNANNDQAAQNAATETLQYVSVGNGNGESQSISDLSSFAEGNEVSVLSFRNSTRNSSTDSSVIVPENEDIVVSAINEISNLNLDDNEHPQQLDHRGESLALPMSHHFDNEENVSVDRVSSVSVRQRQTRNSRFGRDRHDNGT